MGITSDEDTLRAELSIGVKDGRKGLPTLLKANLHPTGRDSLSRA